MWAMVGTAGAGIIAGGVFGLTALAEEERFETNPSEQAMKRGEDRALASDVCFGVAAAAAVVALVLFFTDGETAETPVEARGTSLSVPF